MEPWATSMVGPSNPNIRRPETRRETAPGSPWWPMEPYDLQCQKWIWNLHVIKSGSIRTDAKKVCQKSDASWSHHAHFLLLCFLCTSVKKVQSPSFYLKISGLTSYERTGRTLHEKWGTLPQKIVPKLKFYSKMAPKIKFFRKQIPDNWMNFLC